MGMQEDNREFDERVRVVDRMAVIGDRSIKEDSLKFVIKATDGFIRPRLQRGDPKMFEAVGMGLKNCGTLLPFKAPLYAILAAIICKGDEPFSKELSEKLIRSIAKDFAVALKEGKASIAKRIMRFLACLGCSKLVSMRSIVDYLQTLLKAALHEFTSANRSDYGVHCRGEFLADIALSTLPWVGKILNEHMPDDIANLEDYARQIQEAWKVGKWRCIAPGTSSRCVESFSELLEVISVLADAEWYISHAIIPDVYSEFEEIQEGQEIVLDRLTIPSHSKLTRYSAPRFRIYVVNQKPDQTKKGKFSKLSSKLGRHAGGGGVKPEGPSVKGEGSGEKSNGHDDHDNKQRSDDVVMKDRGKENGRGISSAQRNMVDRFIFRTYISDIVDHFTTNHYLAAERLLTIPMLQKVDDEIVEGLFSQLCAMPDPTFAPVYFGTLFVDLCKVKDSRLPIKLLTAVEAIFQDAGLFDPEAFDRLAEWFSFHLSNFEYKWNWSDWAVYADVDMVDKFPFRALFCKDVLARCIRLSYYERVLDVIPEEMRYFLPPKPTSGNDVRFDATINENLLKVVTGREKQEASVVKERIAVLIPAVKQPMDQDETTVDAEEETNLARLSALIRAILKAGCKTLSHFDTVCERYISLLHEMTNKGGVNAKRLVTLEVSVFWKDVHIRKMYVLDRLCALDVIDGMAVIDSILSEHCPDGSGMRPLTNDELKDKLADSNNWEMIRLVLQRARAREEGARTELTAASHAAATANEGEAEKAENRLNAAKRSTSRAVTEISELLLLAFRKLFSLCNRLLPHDPDDDAEKSEYNQNLPGFEDKPVWQWRVLGMIRELARKHPQFLSNSMLERLENDTAEARERHQDLWDSFDIIKEVESCSMLRQVW